MPTEVGLSGHVRGSENAAALQQVSETPPDWFECPCKDGAMNDNRLVKPRAAPNGFEVGSEEGGTKTTDDRTPNGIDSLRRGRAIRSGG